MTDTKPRRKLAAILAADVVGFSRMMGENEDRTLSNLKACRSITDESITANHGRIFGSAGDSIIAEFASPVDAVVAATDFQRSLKQRNEEVDKENRMEFRVGLNLGDVIVEGENLYGDGVNVAARLEALAEPGGISLSGKFHEEICRKLDMTFTSTGEQEMKNIHNPVPTYKIEISEFSKQTSQNPSEDSEKRENAFQIQSEESDKNPPSIAVLPFKNMSGDPEQDYFVDGITEDIITNLSLWRTFPVISRNSSFTFKDKSLNLKEVANDLGARYIVEGSVRKGGNRLRITAQLIDAQGDHHLWSEKWDRTIEDIFDVQDEVSEAIARRVAPSVTGNELKRLSRIRPKNLSAWEEYLQGLKSYNDRNYSDTDNQGLREACQHFERAISLDETLSDAYAYLALCGFWDLVHFTSEDSKATLEMMKNRGRKAETLNPENPLALIGLAAHYFFSGDFVNAINHAEKAVNYNPSYALSLWWLGLIQAHGGKFQEAETVILKALELSPVDPEIERIYGALYCSYLGQKKYTEALEASDKALQYHPNQGHMIGWRAAALGHLEAGETAKAAVERYLEMRPNLKTRDDFRKIFVPNSMLTEPIIEGLIKAGWKPES